MIRLVRSPRHEQGSALVIALVFLSLFGVFVATLLSGTAVSLRATDVFRVRTDKVFAADGGIEWGLQTARTQDSVCGNVAAGLQTLTSSLPLNGSAVTVTCQALAGAVPSGPGLAPGPPTSPAAQNYAVVTNSLATTGLNPVTVTGGDVYTGTLSVSSNLSVNQGDVVRSAVSCAGVTQPVQLTIGEPDSWSCLQESTTPVALALDPGRLPHVLPPVPPVRNVPTTVVCGGQPWKIHHPGKYTATDRADEHGNLFFESGVYYFEDYSPDFSGAKVVGGEPQAPEPTFLPPPPCPNDTTAGAASQYSGKGVIFILGGSSSITLLDLPGTKFELFTRVPTDGDTSTPGISLFAVPSSGDGYKAWNPAPLPWALNFTGPSAQVAVHGLVYAPTAPVAVYARSIAPLSGGVVAATLTINGASGTLAAVAAQGRRTLLLTSTAVAATAGATAITEKAVAKIANDPARTATVRSWRVQ